MPSHRLIDHQYQRLTLTSEPGAVAAFLEALVEGGLQQIDKNDMAASAPLSPVYRIWAERLLEQHRSLQGISRSLHRLHDEDSLPLLEEAEIAVRNGMAATGRDRQEDFRDATNLLRGLQADAAGGRNYAVWFELGWLLWQMDKLSEAEEAFYQATRLSKAAGNAYYPFALRHLAYVQYLQGNATQAYATIQRARAFAPTDPDIQYEAARYAAVAGHNAEASTLLDECAAENFALLTLSGHEKDFASLGMDFTVRLANAITQRRNQIAQATDAWQRALDLVHEAEKRAGIKLSLPTDLSPVSTSDTPQSKAGKMDYFVVVEAYEKVSGKGEAALQAGIEALETAVSAADFEVERHRRQVIKLHQDKTMWERTLATLEDEARQSGYPLKGAKGFTALRLRIQKRDKQADSVRVSYQNCQHNLTSVEAQIREQVPVLEKAAAEAAVKATPLRDALEWLRAQTL